MIVQDKTKYNTPKYRLVVRITNSNVVCQIVSAKTQGDIVLTSAYSSELSRYGVPVGLTNYAAAYCTGLLVARRVLDTLKLDSMDFDEENGPRAFKACLDVGLHRTTTGAKIFAAMKGAVDGGLNIPHSDKRFPGYSKEKDAVDGEVLRKHIFGAHVADYMRSLKEEDEAAYQKQFSRFIAAGITAEGVEEMYAKAHAAIRANPGHPASPADAEAKKAATIEASKARFQPKLNLKQRKDRVRQKIAAFKAKLEA